MKNVCKCLSLPIVIALALTGCNSSDGNSREPEVKVTDLEPLQVSSDQLVRLGAEQSNRLIRNGIMLNTFGSFGEQAGCTTCEMAVDTAAAESAADDGGFSTTTTQETGVDESDRVKYDGQHIYLASNNYGSYHILEADAGQEQDVRELPNVRILTRNEDDSLTENSIIALGTNVSSVDDLYVNQGNLAAIYHVFEPITTGSGNSAATSDLAIDIWYPYQQKFGLSFNDVSEPNAVVNQATYEIDGYVLSSRRIGNKLYVVSSYAPQLFLDTYPTDESQQQDLYEQLKQDDELQLLPSITSGSSESALVNADACYMPQDAEQNDGFGSVVTLTTFDLAEPEDYDSICLLSSVNGFYASSEAIYFYATSYEQTSGDTDDITTNTDSASTIIHKFAYVQDSVEYAATGKVEGRLGWNNPHLRFSEKNGYLRVLTTQRNFSAGQIDHNLYVLQPDNNRNLNLVAQLPNDDQPKKIGKPGEDVYAVRYFGDKAYVVTFERIDPLYVLDLAEPTDPKIAGELEIPGYSAYLQPLSENYVLGIGQQVDPNVGNSNNVVEGAKVELYDVSDMTSPQVVSTLVFENGYSPVEWDYHALTQLKVSDELFKFALPVYSWSSEKINNNTWQWQETNSMRLLEVRLTGDSAEMTQVGSLEVNSDYHGNWGDRAVLHNDLIYYVRHNDVWQSYWSTPSVLNGPY